jgi:hypothetical protein
MIFPILVHKYVANILIATIMFECLEFQRLADRIVRKGSSTLINASRKEFVNKYDPVLLYILTSWRVESIRLPVEIQEGDGIESIPEIVKAACWRAMM